MKRRREGDQAKGVPSISVAGILGSLGGGWSVGSGSPGGSSMTLATLPLLISWDEMQGAFHGPSFLSRLPEDKGLETAVLASPFIAPWGPSQAALPDRPRHTQLGRPGRPAQIKTSPVPGWVGMAQKPMSELCFPKAGGSVPLNPQNLCPNHTHGLSAARGPVLLSQLSKSPSFKNTKHRSPFCGLMAK